MAFVMAAALMVAPVAVRYCLFAEQAAFFLHPKPVTLSELELQVASQH